MNRNPTHTAYESSTGISGTPNASPTEGPWEARINTASAARFTEIVAGDWPIAHVYGREVFPISANARLIASAPDLLAALKYVAANHHEGEGEFENIINQAIAKAELQP